MKVFSPSPAKRVFEIQAILKELLNTSGKETIIVVEDVDRSGDYGVYFLETLNHFFKNNNFKDKVVVIAPMSDDAYQERLQSYLKSVDYFEFFVPRYESIENFVDRIFDESLFISDEEVNGRTVSGSVKRLQLLSFLHTLFLHNPSLTPRLLKLIIRRAALVFQSQTEDGYEPDWRVTLCVEASKNIISNGTTNRTYFQQFSSFRETQPDNVFSAFLYAIYNGDENLLIDNGEGGMSLHNPRIGFKFARRNTIQAHPSKPWLVPSFADERSSYYICDFYFKY